MFVANIIIEDNYYKKKKIVVTIYFVEIISISL